MEWSLWQGQPVTPFIFFFLVLDSHTCLDIGSQVPSRLFVVVYSSRKRALKPYRELKLFLVSCFATHTCGSWPASEGRHSFKASGLVWSVYSILHCTASSQILSNAKYVPWFPPPFAQQSAARFACIVYLAIKICYHCIKVVVMLLELGSSRWCRAACLFLLCSWLLLCCHKGRIIWVFENNQIGAAGEATISVELWMLLLLGSAIAYLCCQVQTALLL